MGRRCVFGTWCWREGSSGKVGGDWGKGNFRKRRKRGNGVCGEFGGMDFEKGPRENKTGAGVGMLCENGANGMQAHDR